MASYLGNNPDNIITVRKGNYRYVATSGQTVFSGTDSNSLSMAINTADVEVFLNGVLLDQTDYTVTASTVTLGSGATVNDIVEVITNTDFQVASLYTKAEVDSKVATAISDLVGTAGTALNTLGELSDALADDANYAATITTALGTKANSSDVTTSLAAKAPLASPTFTGDVSINSTSALKLPSGTTAQRPSSPTGDMIRKNTTTGYIEYYDTASSSWVGIGAFSASGGNVTVAGSYTYHTFTSSGAFVVSSGVKSIDYLIVAGGGSHRSGTHATGAGGGGAGGAIDSTTTVTPQTYSIVIGAGGAGSTGNGNGSSGANSTAFGQTAIGGGRGASYSGNQPDSGGSGGGGGYSTPNTGGSGTAGQGNAGGTGLGGTDRVGGGGGGAGGAGGNASGSATTATAGNGGVGINWKSLGTYYAGGGGGGAAPWTEGGKTAGTGGLGGGGNGARASSQVYLSGSPGTTNTGGGAGGASVNGPGDGSGDNQAAANGGSGIVILRYLT